MFNIAVSTSGRRKNISFICALVVIVIGFAGLCGWLFDSYFLKSFLSDGATMKVNTALLLIGCGTALLLLAINRAGIARILSVFIMLLSVCILTEYIFKLNLHIDELFFKDTASLKLSETPGRTSLLTALNTLIAGAALLATANRHFRFGQLLAVSVFIIAYISLIGHLFHVTGFYHFGKYSGVAFHTALGLLITNIGILIIEPGLGWLGIVYSRLVKLNVRIYFLSYLLGAAPLMAAIYLFVIEKNALSPASEAVFLILITMIFSMPGAYFLLKAVGRLGKQLSDTDTELQRALNAANLGTWHIHPETKALLYNPTLAKIFGYTNNKPMTYDDAIGQVTDNYREQITREIEKAIKDGGDYNITYQQRRFNDDKVIWLRSTGRVTPDADGNYTVFSGIVMDVTERKQQELLLQSLNEETAAANEELVTSNEELSESKDNLQALIAELAASESQTRGIVEGSPFPIGVYIGKEMRVMFANKAIIDVWGKGADVIGKLYAEILPELDNQLVFKQLEHVFTTGIPFEARNQRLDLTVNDQPKTSYFNYNFTPLINEDGEVYGVINTAADVSDAVIAKLQVEQTSEALNALNEELASINEELIAANEEQNAVNRELEDVNRKYKYSQDELHLAIDAAGLGTFDLNPAIGRFAGNALLKSWFGLQPADEIELHKATDVIAEADRERVVTAIQTSLTYASGGDYDIVYSIISPLDPTPRIVRAKGKVMFNDTHQPIRLSGVLQDITEQKKDEQRKNDFIGMVSHELKTPLTSLTAIVQVLNAKLKTSEDSFVAGALDKANIQVKKMNTMINGFLNISRLESGKIQMDKKEFDLGELTATVIDEARLISTGHVIKFVPGVSAFVYADPEKIGSVVSNLLSNAIKYSSKVTEIELTCQVKDDRIVLSVQDHGIGIKNEDIEHLFDRYYRVNNPNYSHISGFGIGLYLSAEIIKQHSGEIWVESEIGKGSTFYFSIPLKQNA